MTDQRIVGGRYRLGDRLGRGGMAEVYTGVDEELGRPVAVKLLRPELVADPGAWRLFEAEVELVGRLDHPGVVVVQDAGVTDDIEAGPRVPYAVLELVPGQTLQSLVRHGRALAPHEAFRVTLGLLDALAHTHAAGVIHRDVKPGNVVLTPDGSVKLVDFGIARSSNDPDEDTGEPLEVRGTIKYLAPERLRREKGDARTDLYSVGCLLYQLLAGRPPFVGEPSTVVQSQLHARPERPSRLNDALGPDVDAVLLKALAKDPADRYQTADAMWAAVSSLLVTAAATDEAADDRVRPVVAAPALAGRSAAAGAFARPVGAAAGDRARRGVAVPALATRSAAVGARRQQPAWLHAAGSRTARRRTLVAAGVSALVLPLAGMLVYSPDTGDGQLAQGSTVTSGLPGDRPVATGPGGSAAPAAPGSASAGSVAAPGDLRQDSEGPGLDSASASPLAQPSSSTPLRQGAAAAPAQQVAVTTDAGSSGIGSAASPSASSAAGSPQGGAQARVIPVSAAEWTSAAAAPSVATSPAATPSSPSPRFTPSPGFTPSPTTSTSSPRPTSSAPPVTLTPTSPTPQRSSTPRQDERLVLLDPTPTRQGRSERDRIEQRERQRSDDRGTYLRRDRRERANNDDRADRPRRERREWTDGGDRADHDERRDQARGSNRGRGNDDRWNRNDDRWNRNNDRGRGNDDRWNRDDDRRQGADRGSNRRERDNGRHGQNW